MEMISDNSTGVATRGPRCGDVNVSKLDLFDLLRQAIIEERCGGKPGRTYDIGYGLFAKRADSREEAYNEFETGRDLWVEGIHVPEMIKLIGPRWSVLRPAHRRLPGEHTNFYHIIMKYVQGKHLNKLDETEFQHAKRLVLEELVKVLEFRLLPLDADHVGNSLYDPERERVVLLDLTCWRKSGREHIEKFRKNIIAPMRKPDYRFRTTNANLEEYYL